MVVAKGLDKTNHEIITCKTFIKNTKPLENNHMGNYQLYRDLHFLIISLKDKTLTNCDSMKKQKNKNDNKGYLASKKMKMNKSTTSTTLFIYLYQ